MDMSSVVRIVDAWTDNDPKTRDSCPGKINGNDLIPIGIQWNRRLRFFKRQKYIIYQENGTRNIWYKRSKCNAGVVAMGFSLSRLSMHPKSIPMSQYAKYFIDHINPTWLKRNNYQLI